MQASSLKEKGKTNKKTPLRMHFCSSKSQILSSDSMKCHVHEACVHDQTIYREKKLAFGVTLKSMLSLLALLTYFGLALP